MNYSARQELTIPLIGTLPREADVENQSLVEDTRSDQEDIADDSACECFLSVSVPLVLLAQFAIAFLCICVAGTFHLEWKEVFCSVIIFSITSTVYRRTLRDEKISLAILHMVPEITTLVVCCLAYFHYVDLGFVSMILSMMFMSLFIIAASIHMIWMAYREANEENKQESSTICVV